MIFFVLDENVVYFFKHLIKGTKNRINKHIFFNNNTYNLTFFVLTKIFEYFISHISVHMLS